MSNKMKVHVLECGTVTIPSSMIYYDETAKYPDCMALFLNPPEKIITIPVLAFLIEHPNGQKILFDTAWSPYVRDKSDEILGMGRYSTIATLPEGQCVTERLAAMGLKPEDIDVVVISHMHVDHVGALLQLKGAKKILTSRVEREAAGDGAEAAYRKCCWDGADIETFEYDDMGIGPMGLAKDLFGDGSVMIVATPGHSDGHSSLLLRNNGKQLLLTGDNGYSRKSWRERILPGHAPDPENTLKSLDWVKKFDAENDNVIDIVSDHEADLAAMEYEF